MGIETYAASDQDHKDDQDAFAKGYNLPILQGDIDQAKKETEELLDCIESMYRPYLDDGINRIPDYQYRIRVSDD